MIQWFEENDSRRIWNGWWRRTKYELKSEICLRSLEFLSSAGFFVYYLICLFYFVVLRSLFVYYLFIIMFSICLLFIVILYVNQCNCWSSMCTLSQNFFWSSINRVNIVVNVLHLVSRNNIYFVLFRRFAQSVCVRVWYCIVMSSRFTSRSFSLRPFQFSIDNPLPKSPIRNIPVTRASANALNPIIVIHRRCRTRSRTRLAWTKTFHRHVIEKNIRIWYCSFIWNVRNHRRVFSASRFWWR